MINSKFLIFIVLLCLGYNQEIITFESSNPFSFKDIITDLENQNKQEVFGILTFPENKGINKKYPLVVGVAGSDGWGDHHYDYLKMYRDNGIATFELKSFTSRGITTTVGTQTEVTMAMMILDSYRALDKLALHPNVNIENIAITGWSLGGGVSLFSGWEKLIKAIGSNNRFSAHLPIYPPCMIRVGDLEFTDAPIHILIGELDTWTPASACETLVSDLSKHKDNISLTIYENSHHSFDSTKNEEIIEHGYSFTDCMFDISDDGAVLMNYFNIPMTSPFLQKIGLAFCVDRGPVAGGNSEARQDALEFSKLFMSTHLLDIN